MSRALLISILLASAASCAALPQVRSEVEIHAPVVKVGDLLTADSKAELSPELLDCTLTPAPQPGTTRTMLLPELRSLLLAKNVDPSRLLLPASLKVSRWSRTLSDHELRAAAQRYFEQQHISGVELEGQLKGSTLIGIDDPELRVTGFELDRSEHLARLRFKIVNAGVNEFWISTPARFADGLSAHARFASTSSSLYIAAAAPRPKPRPVTLVHTMKTATLTVIGEGFQFTTQVRPLQNGVAGEVIPARDEQTGKIFHAAVIGPQQLQIGQQVATER